MTVGYEGSIIRQRLLCQIHVQKRVYLRVGDRVAMITCHKRKVETGFNVSETFLGKEALFIQGFRLNL